MKEQEIIARLQEAFPKREQTKTEIVKALSKEFSVPQSYVLHLWSTTFTEMDSRVRANRMRSSTGQKSWREKPQRVNTSDAYQSLPRQRGTVKYVTRNPKNISKDNPGYLWYDSDAEKIPYHNIVYCQAHGMTCIPQGYFVYHLDRDLSNNEPENLQMFSYGEFQEYMQKCLVPDASLRTLNKVSTEELRAEAKRLLLEAEGYDEMPFGYTIVYLDGNEANVALENLKLVSILEAGKYRK